MFKCILWSTLSYEYSIQVFADAGYNFLKDPISKARKRRRTDDDDEEGGKNENRKS